MYKLIVLNLIGLFLLGSLFAQQRLHIDHSCSYVGQLSESDIYGFSSGSEAESALRRIMKYTGLPSNFKIMAANVPNAAAVIRGSDRYILYNQYFMDRVKKATFTDWSAISILAHEIGHHLSGHTLTNTGSRPDKELEADKFSGFVLYKMGASLDQARAAMKSIGSERGSSTHPPKSARLAAITNGWMEAKELVGSKGTKPTTTRKTYPGTTTTRKNYPKPVYRTASSQFKRIWVESDVYQNGKKGIKIHANFDINYVQNQRCRMVAWIYHTDGKKVQDKDGSYNSTDGQVCAYKYFTPTYERSNYGDMSVFLPYSQLHLPYGSNYRLKVKAGLFDKNVKKVGDYSNYAYFSYNTRPKITTRTATSQFQKVWLESDIYENGQKGMRVHAKFNINYLQYKDCKMVAWFSYSDGRPLKDTNGEKRTSTGQVALSVKFKPIYERATFNDLSVFIPYDELHVTRYGKTSLKVRLGLFDHNIKKVGNSSNDLSFTYTRR